jgi:hypothetical protein
MWKRLSVALAVASTGLVAIYAPPAGAVPVPIACGATLTRSVVLTRDLTCNALILRVTAANVTVDLGGHTITMTNAPKCFPDNAIVCAIQFEAVKGTLRNGTLRGAGVSGSATIRNVNLIDGDIWMTGKGTTVSQSFLTDGDITFTASDEHADKNWIKGGQVRLFNSFRSLQGVSVTGNLIINSPADGIAETPNFFGQNDVTADLSGNVVVGSAGAGIHLGRNLQDLGAVTITGNTVSNNKGSGIDINGVAAPNVPFTGGPVTVKNNTAVGNGGHGIDARWIPNLGTGIVDGGGNKATANQTAPACLGVACV